MRFFSNEAKDNDTDQRTDDDRTEPLRTEPSTVPQQRAGSPWQHGPADNAVKDEQDDRTVAFSSGAAQDRAGSQDPTVAINDTGRSDTDRLDSDRLDTGNDSDRLDTDRTVTDRLDTDRTDADADVDKTAPLNDGRHRQENDADDTGAGTSWAGPTVTHPDEAGVTDAGVKDSTVKDSTVKDADEAKRDDEPVDLPLDDHDTPKDRVEDPAPVDTTPAVVTPVTPVEETPVAETPKETTISGPAPFFPESDTQALRERWRDVQLRFVDDPKAATSDAATLVDEAVDKLTTALKEHRGAVVKGEDDTEGLRVELRSYRDILDRLLGL
ncbi:hypothetical protein [Actinoplanes sp. NBRC 101535]|uniref:hypothetical protein n=1 Tax=Actinoplanes sp. NBRC 101535 TaxID=3032196 RepID=UPI0024A2FE62|nr:hypothetical protein [Actinoplanes sp. NBRC 101535]GLY01335.1 hypothetical protein Acsp01_17140 [Actinoplanes sp. NBRC 101535]